jgi:hypothetical protein
MHAPEHRPTVKSGYAELQIAKALLTSEEHPDADTRQRALAKIQTWKTVLSNILSGAIAYGARTPVSGAPGWVTLDVAAGGFATGGFSAGGPLQPHEKELLADFPGVPKGEERTALNMYYLSETGMANLREQLSTGCFDIAVPEEGALLIVAWLAAHGEAEEARRLLEQISPWFDRLRFYPIPTDRPRRLDGRVCLESVADTLEQLSDIEPKPEILRQKEAVEVWAPLRDRLVALFVETVVDDWPCRNFASGWRERAIKFLEEFAEHRKQHALCATPDKKGGHFRQLREFLGRCVVAPERLTGREVGRIRTMLKRYYSKYEAPDSEKCMAIRRRQRADVSEPLFSEVAGVVISRLKGHEKDDGVDDVTEFCEPVSAEEENRRGVPRGTVVPSSVQRKVEKCHRDTPEKLIRRGLITSGDTLARVLPQITSTLRAVGIADIELRRLYAAVCSAFARRRSLLLLNLEKQIQIGELPWISVIERFRDRNISPAELPTEATAEIVVLAVTSFPHAVLPNKLLQEIRNLTKSAGIELPLVEEVAADIFMGAFSPKYTRAAKVAAELLAGTTYANYYDIDYAEVRELPDRTQGEPGKRTFFSGITTPVDEFAEMCRKRAGVQGGSTAANGMIIEQQQVLTTQNLAVVFQTFGLTEKLRPQLRMLAESVFKRICERLQVKARGYHAWLIMMKNSAYAWRQMIFYISLIPPEERAVFLQYANNHFNAQPREFQTAFAPAMEGLIQAAKGSRVSDDGRRFLGWSKDHWLIAGLGGPANE